MTNVTSVAPSQARLVSDAMPWPTSPRQCHRQHNSTWPSPTWLGSDVTLRLTSARQRHDHCRLGSTITSTTRQWCHATTNIDSAVPIRSPAWLDSDITPLPTLAQQRCHQHDSEGLAFTSLTNNLAQSFTTRLCGSKSATPTDGLTRVHCYLHHRF
jgi:hypothetical protein